VTVPPPDEAVAWLGEDAARVRTLAEIWATVDLERALAAIDAADGSRPAGRGVDPRGAVGDPLLGARVLLLPPRDRRRIALAEPFTEGRLAATLARHGEGRVGSYLRAPIDLDLVRVRAAGAAVPLSRREDGPFGSSVLVLGGRIGGRLVILVDPAAVPSRP